MNARPVSPNYTEKKKKKKQTNETLYETYRREEPPPTGVYPRDKEIIQRSIDESVGLDVYICSTTGGGQRQSGRTFLRGPATSLQQRQQRLRSYGVIAAHGDGQTLLPMNNNNNNNSNTNTDSSQAHRHVNNSQQYSSEIQLRRVPPSTSTSSTTIVSNSYSHDPRNQQQGMRTIRLVAKPRATR